MKKILLLIIVLFLGFVPKINGQGTEAAILGSVNAGNVIEGAIAGLNEVANYYSQISAEQSKWMAEHEKLKTAIDWVHDMETIYQIVQLLDNISCMMTETRNLQELSGSFRSCHIDLKFQMTLVNMQYSTDVFRKAFIGSNLLKMTSGERLVTLKAILTTLQESLADFESINSSIRTDIMANIVHNYRVKSIANRGSLGLSR